MATDFNQRRARRLGLARLERDRARERNDERNARAREKWEMGLVVPAHITIALDALDLFGPQVDIACGVVEPAVDRWEAGRLYPRWEQILLLADLTGRQPWWFMAPVHPVVSAYDTSMRFHRPRGAFPGEHYGYRDPMPVLRFTAKALYEARLFGVKA